MAVYQRILKPFPTCTLEPGAAPDDQTLVVFATLHRAGTHPRRRNASGQSDDASPAAPSLPDDGDDSDAVMSLLNGSLRARFVAGVAKFSKLKIQSTSTQMGCLFKLRFQLQRFIGG